MPKNTMSKMPNGIGRKSYNDYVNHMVKFFLSCLDGLTVAGHSPADIQNWLAVQQVWSDLSDGNKELQMIYGSKRPYRDSVDMYAAAHSMTSDSVWWIVTDICAKIAKARGLV